MVELFARLLELGFKVANLFQSAPTRDYIGGVDGETEKAEKAKERERGGVVENSAYVSLSTTMNDNDKPKYYKTEARVEAGALAEAKAKAYSIN